MHNMILILILRQLFAINHRMDDLAQNLSEYTDMNMLLAVQLLLPKIDSKEFVDRPTKRPLEEVKDAFRKIEGKLGISRKNDLNFYTASRILNQNLNSIIGENLCAADERIHTFQTINTSDLEKIEVLKGFLDENFLPVGTDIQVHVPVDYNESPRFLGKLKDQNLIKVASALNKKWKELSRRSVDFKNGEQSTLLELPKPFIIPGGRFREYYYWDTYWILEGLLICDMDKSAENIIRNFMHIINTYGYIPNGLRKYYLYRSHPPYFPSMLLKLLDYKNGKFNNLVLGEGLEMAIKEYDFFMKFRSRVVVDKNNNEHILNVYRVRTDFPRPESFGEDVLTYKNQNILSDDKVYSNLKSGAESGWDFSSRWLIDPTDLRTINAYNQIPVDLNALLYRNERIFEMFFKRKGDLAKTRFYGKRADRRLQAINTFLWNENETTWMDYDMTSMRFVAHRFYFSNVEPLVYGIKPPGNVTFYDVLKKYHLELFGYPGGIPASGDGPSTNQQWDFPNAWAPHQHMMVDFLISQNEHKMALHIAKSFSTAVFAGFESEKDFYEKYNVKEPGSTGAGGEYAPQTGFGWTNGTTLSFINHFGDELMKREDHISSYKEILEYLTTKTKKQAAKKKNETIVYEIQTQPLTFAEILNIPLK